MRNFFFLVLFVTLLGCQRDSAKKANSPISGMHEFKVTLLFLPSEDLDKESFFKTVVSSFEKIGNVQISDEEVYAVSNALPILMLSYGMKSGKRASLNVFAEVEILANRCRIGSQIWKKDFDFSDSLTVPVEEEGKIVFREQKATERLSSQQGIEKMIEEFATMYHEDNTIKPTFKINSKFVY